ncbi:hypothetical protein NEDG_00717 [Nematocida displodere]|uniref:Uncharacterized protein n=1 Tax=Nematocida displodere TaxID=1805483 RepID=A0A177ECA7_9MICR|nr:hypothetical protein NEDG_00717 [Nematocida displodere]
MRIEVAPHSSKCYHLVLTRTYTKPLPHLPPSTLHRLFKGYRYVLLHTSQTPNTPSTPSTPKTPNIPNTSPERTGTVTFTGKGTHSEIEEWVAGLEKLFARIKDRQKIEKMLVDWHEHTAP